MSGSLTLEQQIAAARARRDALRDRMMGGVVRVATGDRSVQYATPAEMATALKASDAELAALERSAATPRRRLVRQVYFTASKGL